MANKSFNFGKMKRSFYTTTLKDGKVVIVNMPKKRTFEKMQEISDLDEEEVDGKEVYKTMLSLMAEILSNNKNGERITAEYLENEEYDIEEIVAYINDYGKEYCRCCNGNFPICEIYRRGSGAENIHNIAGKGITA